MRKLRFVTFAIAISLLSVNCKKEVNIFTVNQDIEFGQQMKEHIESNPDEFTLLDKAAFPDAYAHLERIRDNILNSGELKYQDRFSWEVYIVHNDEVLNAFATPGGYMYFYTGLIHFLDNEAQFAGVMGHEMAHADLRHSTKSLTKRYGYSVLLSALLGNNPGIIAEIAASLATGLADLAFSRDHEYESDEYAVIYSYTTDYQPNSVGDFFSMLEGSSRPPEFLSTHPNPGNRVDKINEKWTSLGGKSGDLFEERYQQFKNSLP